jgi:outer membrane protein TolC
MPPNPTLGLGFGMIPQDDFGLSNAGMRTISLSQRIPFPGKLVSGGRSASHIASAMGQAYRITEREVIWRVKDLFWRLYEVHESIRITRETRDLLKNLAEVAETKYAVGRGAAGDVLKAQVELARTENDIFALDRRLMTTEARMKALLNRPQSLESVGMPENPSLKPLVPDLDELDSLAGARRPQLVAARELVLAASAMHTTSKMDYLPDFMITVKQQNLDVGMDTWEVMFSAEIPLWMLFRENKKLKETGAILASRKASVDDAVNATRSLVESAYNRYETARRTLETYEVAVIPQAEMSLKSARASYENDVRDFLSLLDAERSLLKIRLEYARAQAEFEKSIAELEMIVGEDLPRG